MLRFFVCLGAGMLIVSASASASGPSHVQVSGAWARATAPGQDEGAVYMSITAAGADRLLGVASPDAAAAMLHRATRQGGMEGMEDMDGLDLASGQTTTLAPRGTHVMLMGLKHPLVAGSHIAVDLDFAHAGHLRVEVPVRPIGFAGAPN